MQPKTLFLASLALATSSAGVLATLNPEGSPLNPLPLASEFLRPLAPKSSTPVAPVAVVGWAQSHTSTAR